MCVCSFFPFALFFTVTKMIRFTTFSSHIISLVIFSVFFHIGNFYLRILIFFFVAAFLLRFFPLTFCLHINLNGVSVFFMRFIRIIFLLDFLPVQISVWCYIKYPLTKCFIVIILFIISTSSCINKTVCISIGGW